MALSKEAFIAAAWDVVGRKVSKERLLADIYETARTSIGLPLPIDAPAIRMFRMVIAEARCLIRQRNEIEDMADAMLRESADYKALRKVPGIGPVVALTILAEGGDLSALPPPPPVPWGEALTDSLQCASGIEFTRVQPIKRQPRLYRMSTYVS